MSSLIPLYLIKISKQSKHQFTALSKKPLNLVLEKQYPRLIILILFIAFLLGNERESFSDISYLLLLELKWF